LGDRFGDEAEIAREARLAGGEEPDVEVRVPREEVAPMFVTEVGRREG
jgi:hypothetical protein